jgi:hypothetical protein
MQKIRVITNNIQYEFSENLPDKLKITEDYVGYGQIQEIREKRHLKIIVISGIIPVPLIFAFCISH